LGFCHMVLLVITLTLVATASVITTSEDHVCGNDLSCYLGEEPTTLILNSTELSFNSSSHVLNQSVDIYAGLYNVSVSCANTFAGLTTVQNVSISLSGFTLLCGLRLTEFTNVTLRNVTVKGTDLFVQIIDSENVVVEHCTFRDIVDHLGAGLFPTGLSIETAESARLETCSFINNARTIENFSFRGIIANFLSVDRVFMYSCLFEDNRSLSDTGDTYIIYAFSKEAQVVNSQFINNGVSFDNFEDECAVGTFLFSGLRSTGQVLIDSCVFENNTCIKKGSATLLGAPGMIGIQSNITIRNTRYTKYETTPPRVTNVIKCPGTQSTDFLCEETASKAFPSCQTEVYCQNLFFVPTSPPTLSPTSTPTFSPIAIPTTASLPEGAILSFPIKINGDFVNTKTATLAPGGFLEVEGCIVIPENTTFIIDLTHGNDTTENIGAMRTELIRSNSNCINGTFELVSPQCIVARIERTLSSLFVVTSRSESCESESGLNVGLVLGVSFGILALLVIVVIAMFAIPKLRHSTVPYSLRRSGKKVASAEMPPIEMPPNKEE